MSNDLISRKELIEKLEEWCGDQRYLIPEDVRKIIQNLPTAFDKEKVIEELIAGRFVYTGENIIGECTNIGINKAIGIVEKGGIE